MQQLSRLIQILTLLKSKRVLTASELAERFDVSIRTIYRDIRKLEEAGVPVITLDGIGYSLMDGYTVAPVQFTEKEANALITAQALVKQTQDTSFIEDFDQSMTKIKSVFRTSIQEQSERLNKQLFVFDARGYVNLESNALSELQMAIIHLKFVEINYQKAEDPNVSFRRIEPYALFSTQNKWILIAWCHLRKEYRAFRLDRIKHFRVLNETFSDRKFDLQAYFSSCPWDESRMGPPPKRIQ